MSEPKRKVACVIARDAEGKILLQMRDSGGGNVNPINALRWGFFGGHFEAGESPTAAAVREFEEETTVVISEDDLELIGEGMSGDGGYYLFVVKRAVSWREIEVREGAGAGFFTREEMEKIPLVLSTEALMRKLL